MSALNLIFDKLLAGETFGKIEQHRLGGTFFWDVLSASNGLIRWRHYGSSANKATLTGLKWILETIFQTTPEQFLYDYTTYSKWKEIDKSYERHAC